MCSRGTCQGVATSFVDVEAKSQAIVAKLLMRLLAEAKQKCAPPQFDARFALKTSMVRPLFAGVWPAFGDEANVQMRTQCFEHRLKN
jgi:hypothetical protein